MEAHQKEMKDPSTSEERRKELEIEVQEQQKEMQSNKNVIVDLEKRLQGASLENEGKNSAIELHYSVTYYNRIDHQCSL